MEDMKSEHAFALHRKTAELLDELKQVNFGTQALQCAVEGLGECVAYILFWATPT